MTSRRHRYSRTLRLGLGGFALLTWGCDAGAPEAPSQANGGDLAAQVHPAGADCLAQVWQAQAAPDREFDRANDLVEGGTISCATGTSASEFAAALQAIRSAAASRDRAALLRETGRPLLYIDPDGQRREMAQSELATAPLDEIFSDDVLSAMRDLDLAEMTVVPRQGAFFDLGSVWLVADRIGGRPRLVTVNRQALDEATAATAQG